MAGILPGVIEGVGKCEDFFDDCIAVGLSLKKHSHFLFVNSGYTAP
jgi:hypothetical protein